MEKQAQYDIFQADLKPICISFSAVLVVMLSSIQTFVLAGRHMKRDSQCEACLQNPKDKPISMSWDNG